jgi:hypothetical protein
MRTETDPTETQGEWKPLGSPTNRPKTEPEEWQKVPDAPGVEYNWKTGKTRTNMPLPSAWVEDLAMQEKDCPSKFNPWGYFMIHQSLEEYCGK